MRKNYYNISSTTNVTSEKTPVATKKSTTTSGENLLQQRQKQNETSKELLCNIKEMLVATTKKGTIITFNIIYCNIENESLQKQRRDLTRRNTSYHQTLRSKRGRRGGGGGDAG
jgi:hypothetical protein